MLDLRGKMPKVHLKIDVKFEDCSEEIIEKIEETSFVETEAKIQELQREINFLQQLLLDADEVARQRGDEFGLCDAMNNGGQPYPSASSAELLQKLKDQGRKPMLFLKDLEG